MRDTRTAGQAIGVDRPPGPLDRLLIPASVLRMTVQGLSSVGAREMLCYWAGTALPPDRFGNARAIVTTVMFPQVFSGYAQFQLVEGQMGRVTQWCSARGLWVLAQVHTHPNDEPHSEADECWPASHRAGFLSVVFPYFARRSSLENPLWHVYESAGGGAWEELDPLERCEILPDLWLSEREP